MATGSISNARHTRPLNEIGAADAAWCGGKSASLGELLSAGIPVPPGFAISVSAFTGLVADAGLQDVIGRAVHDAGSGELADLRAAAAVMTDAIRSASMGTALADELDERYAQLGTSVGISEPPVAVRSSAVGEDGAQATFAGQQESYLWVRGAAAVRRAVSDCWASLYSAEAISYRRHRAAERATAAPAMGVTVQLMVDAEISGVMFTCNPVSGDPSMVAVNASWGLGLAVVGGEITPDDHLVSKVTGEIVRETISDKPFADVPRRDGSGTVRVAVDPERRQIRCLDAARLRTLAELGCRLERHFGTAQDIEWAIAGGHGVTDGLFVLQSRPVTGLSSRAPAPSASALSMVMGTFGARPVQARE